MSGAGASHGTNVRDLAAISVICLAHGPALLALGLHGVRSRWFGAAALLLVLGTLVFVSDLALRQGLGVAPLPLAAPVGGVAMIGGWALVVLGAIAGQATE
ncbi:DUF423 domain-containing protein [Devosia rhodophyticola]|uniref:DUF423 domain-containing protein n=1 Tax=Devosia rhodophyticola TaxID=3026423 RepID=A0ABY7YWD4_9HYPH|nr:DUF423 domain-containing protein [Devosia rhodophyticola]WDR05365.1 DUF423 domain-containing protein [Devosia rhodophyticola]